MMSRREKIIDIMNHKQALKYVAEKILDKNTLARMKKKITHHDCDKLLLLCYYEADEVSKVHRIVSSHHDKAETKEDFIEMILDWECSSLTKKKPLNAYDTLYLLFPEHVKEVAPILKELGIHYSYESKEKYPDFKAKKMELADAGYWIDTVNMIMAEAMEG